MVLVIMIFLSRVMLVFVVVRGSTNFSIIWRSMNNSYVSHDNNHEALMGVIINIIKRYNVKTHVFIAAVYHSGFQRYTVHSRTNRLSCVCHRLYIRKPADYFVFVIDCTFEDLQTILCLSSTVHSKTCRLSGVCHRLYIRSADDLQCRLSYVC